MTIDEEVDRLERIALACPSDSTLQIEPADMLTLLREIKVRRRALAIAEDHDIARRPSSAMISWAVNAAEAQIPKIIKRRA